MATPAPTFVPPAKPADSARGPRWSPRMQAAFAFVLGACTLLLLQNLLGRWLYHGRPAIASERTSESVSLPPAQLDLNVAGEKELRFVPGIGPILGARIVQHRLRYGAYACVDDLLDVPGIGPNLVEGVRPYLYTTRSTGTSLASPIAEGGKPPTRRLTKQAPTEPLDLNRATREQFQSLPGIGPVLAERIVADRAANGPFRKVSDLTRIHGIKSKTLEKVLPFVQVGDEPIAKAGGVSG